MNQARKEKLEEKLHQNILGIIDEFIADYGVSMTKVQYTLELFPNDTESHILETDMR